MPDTPPTATVAGQSIALHVAGYPDVPNRWGAGHIRVTSLRLDYGSSRTPAGRHAFLTGLWVRYGGEVTDDPLDQSYEAPDGDTSKWPDWIGELAKAHDPTTVPQPNDDRRDLYATALAEITVGHRAFIKADVQAEHARADVVIAIADAEQAELRLERDLAIAHDRQPYPTAWAYEQACMALHRKTDVIARVTAVYEHWVAAGPPPLGTLMPRWWDRRLAELHAAMKEPEA